MLPLMDMKITSHEQVVSGVYKITYDYSKVVYVNYNLVSPFFAGFHRKEL